MPIRKIPKNYRNVTGVVAAHKADGEAGFESGLERDLLSLLEFDPRVEKFEVQPIHIFWSDADGKRHQYTPDCLARYKDSSIKTTLFEAKYRAELRENWGDLRPRFRAAVHHASSQGWKFKIVTEEEIRTPYLDNVRFLLPFLRRGIESTEDRDMLLGIAGTLRETTPARLLAAIEKDQGARAHLLPTLWFLIGSFEIGADLSAPLVMESRIWSLQ